MYANARTINCAKIQQKFYSCVIFYTKNNKKSITRYKIAFLWLCFYIFFTLYAIKTARAALCASRQIF